jgi:hypothetical protein
MLFSDVARTDVTAKRYDESSFTHLDRRAGAKFDRIRDLIECWFARLPSEGRYEMLQRFRSSDDTTFHSSFLELYTHELLIRTDHSVEVHPELEATTKRPDFGAADEKNRRTNVECTVVSEVSAQENAANRRRNDLHARIESIKSPDYFLDLDIDGDAVTPIPVAQLCSQLRCWLDAQDYDEIVAKWKLGRACVPSLQLEHDGLKVTVRPFPKRQESRGREGCQTIGIQSFEPVWGTSRFAIRDALRAKATRYGPLPVPYIVVVNCIGELCDGDDIDDAIYDREGLWPPNRPRFTRLSAVLAIHHLFPWSIPRCSVRLYHNPAAKYPYSGALTCLPQVVRNAEEITRIAGRHPREILELSEDWPNS